MIVAVVLLPVGQNVAHSIECNVEKILGHPNACQTSAGPTPSNEVVCQTSSQTNSSSDNVEVLFLKVGHDQTLIETKFSNGQVQYTLTDSKKAEAVANLVQGQAEVGGVGMDFEVEAAAGGALDGAHTWTFPNQAAADAFAKQVNSSGSWGQVAHDAASLGNVVPILGPVSSWAGNGLLNLIGIHGAPNPDDLAKQNLTYSYLGLSAIAEVSGKAEAGLGGEASLQLDAELKGAAGIRVITSASPVGQGASGGQNGAVPLKKGDVQLFLNLDGSGNAALQDLLFGPNAGGSVKTKGTAVVTLSPNGQLQMLQITGSADGTGTAGLDGNNTQGSGLVQKLGLKVSDGAGGGINYTGTLNLTSNPAAQQQLISLLGGGATAGPALAQLATQIDQNGTQRLQPYTVSRSTSGAGLEGEILDVGGGAAATVNQQNQSFNAGWIKAPSNGWQPVICKR